MVSKPPPSRYKIVEKGGRLITVDTWAGSETSAEPLRTSALSPQPRPLPMLLSGPAQSDLAMKFAAIMTRGERDAAGNFVLRTAKFYDAEAPRRFRLTQEQARELGGYGFLITIAFVILGVFALLTNFMIALFVAVFLGFRLAPSFLRPLMKRFLAKAEQIE